MNNFEIDNEYEIDDQTPDVGEKGDPGKDGLDGLDGIDGIDGKDGRDGIDGKDGVDGKSIQGRPGRDGLDGKNGTDGKNGLDGLKGKPGDDGIGLEFKWDGTKLGIKREDEKTFKFKDLSGPTHDGDLLFGSRKLRVMSTGAGVSLVGIANSNKAAIKSLVAGSNVTITDNGTTVTIASSGGGGGAGDVVGPTGATANAIARYSGTTGKIIQDYTSNPPTITDNGQVFIGPAGISPTSIGTVFNTYCTDMTSNVILNSFQALGAVPSGGNVQALQFNVTDSGTANISTLTGINGLAVKAGSGSVGSMNGISGGVRITGTVTATTMASFLATSRVLVGCSAATVIAFSAGANVVSGSVAALYGVKVAAQKIANVTTGYGIGTDGVSDINYFLGTVGVGTSTPSTSIHSTGPIRCGSYTVATVPSASSSGAGAMIYVTNETGGANIAASDGTNWRRVSDRAIIS